MAINRRKAVRSFLIAGAFLATFPTVEAGADWSHGMAMHGKPALPPDFANLPYANPEAPQGGRITVGWIGTFDSLNPLIVRGVFPPGLRAYSAQEGGYVYESLMKRNLAEPFTLYGLLAESVDLPEHRRTASFRINPAARFSDGHPVTADDVIFTAELLREKGRPNHRDSLAQIARIEKLGDREVRFVFRDGTNRELPMIIGLMPILPKHAVDPENFGPNLKPPIGSGPYTVASVTPGASIVYQRNPEYWGRDLAINRGHYRFDEIQFDAFRDANSMFEAFKRGLLDVRFEDSAKIWLNGYDFPAARAGRVVKETFPTGLPKGLSGFAFNTRRSHLSDPKVREALTLLFDFGWVNRNLYGGVYVRTDSFFDDSELSGIGRPAGEREKALLAPFPDAVRSDILAGTWSLPVSDGRGRDRAALRRAMDLFREAGYAVDGGVLKKTAAGEPLRLEILVRTRDEERIALNYAGTLKQAGVEVSVRHVDLAQFEQRRETFDFDMAPFAWPASLSPGTEQRSRWLSASAEINGSFNLPGVRSKAVDAMIGALLEAREREEFVAAVRALDRVLMSGFYVLPTFHRPVEWVARWTHIKHPAAAPLAGYTLETWWREDGTKP